MTVPADTKQLMDIKAFVEKVENQTYFELENKLGGSRDRLHFLVDHAYFNPVDIRNNADPFLWHQRLPQVFEEHRGIVADKKVQYEEALKVNELASSFIFLLC